MNQTSGAFMALDIGDARIGVALASAETQIAHPLTTITIDNDETALNTLAALIETHKVGTLVVGLPRNMSGEYTEQTSKIRDFAKKLKEKVHLEPVFQDESLTSVKAEEELRSRNKPYTKSDIDSLAATYILEDYLLYKL